jgi:hypothetical protein
MPYNVVAVRVDGSEYNGPEYRDLREAMRIKRLCDKIPYHLFSRGDEISVEVRRMNKDGTVEVVE